MEKVFRIEGWFKKRKKKIEFKKEMIANSKERVVERLYSEIGSKHAVKRNLINIVNVEDIKPEEAENPEIRALAEVE